MLTTIRPMALAAAARAAGRTDRPLSGQGKSLRPRSKLAWRSARRRRSSPSRIRRARIAHWTNSSGKGKVALVFYRSADW